MSEYAKSRSRDATRWSVRRLGPAGSLRGRTWSVIWQVLIGSQAVALCLAVTGCQSPVENEPPQSHASGTSSGDPLDQVGYGHDRPPHKPESFREAVTEIRRRWQELETETSGPADKRRQELDEILVWLPELAAETDLGKVEWDQVNAISKRLLTGFRAKTPGQETLPAHETPPPSNRSSSESWTVAWEELAAVAATLTEE
jgi:hypothetical protein